MNKWECEIKIKLSINRSIIANFVHCSPSNTKPNRDFVVSSFFSVCFRNTNKPKILNAFEWNISNLGPLLKIAWELVYLLPIYIYQFCLEHLLKKKTPFLCHSICLLSRIQCVYTTNCFQSKYFIDDYRLNVQKVPCYLFQHKFQILSLFFAQTLCDLIHSQ